MPFWHMILTALNLVGARFGGAAIGLASQILLARLLTQDQVGVVFMGMSAAAIVSLLVTGGYPLLAITCLPRYYALGRINLVTAFHAAFWRDTLVLSLIVFAAATGVILWLPVDEALKTALLFGCLSAPASALLRMNGATANSLRRYTLSYVPDFLFRPGLLLVYLMLAWLAGIPLSVTHVLWAFIIANTVVALGQAWLMGSAGAVPRFTAKLGRGLAPYLRGRAAPDRAAQARSMSAGMARARPAMMGRRTAPAMVFTASKSPSEEMGKPASMMSTPRRSSCWARRSFSAGVMLKPGACSPSRSVVSNT